MYSYIYHSSSHHQPVMDRFPHDNLSHILCYKIYRVDRQVASTFLPMPWAPRWTMNGIETTKWKQDSHGKSWKIHDKWRFLAGKIIYNGILNYIELPSYLTVRHGMDGFSHSKTSIDLREIWPARRFPVAVPCALCPSCGDTNTCRCVPQIYEFTTPY